MEICADFSKRVVIHSDTMDWIDSPMAGVQRKPLDRVGAEVARATTLVRYQPGSAFSPHVHTGGEEFLVLEGTFEDEHGQFPVGAYIRNPPLSKHQPSARNGCVILVKLWQFRPEDRTHIRIQSDTVSTTTKGQPDGITMTPLYQDEHEEVCLLTFAAYATLNIATPNGAELLVLQGALTEQQDNLVKYSWLRLPLNSQLNAQAGEHGANIWLKRGHLNQVDAQIKYLQQQQ